MASTIGGLLIQLWHWLSIFVLLLGIISLLIVLCLLKESKDTHPDRSLDIRGQLYGVIALGALVLAMVELSQSVSIFAMYVLILFW